MLSSAMLARIAQLNIVTKRFMEGPLVGDMLTARRGYGVEFHQIRDYVVGDDVRFIDWRGTARLSRLLVKECLEERNRKIIIALDVSASSRYGSQGKKIDWMRDVAATLAFAGHCAKDSVGLVLFSDGVERAFEPQATQAAIQALVHAVYESDIAWGKRTDLSEVLRYIAHRWSKDAIVFVISDFVGEQFDQALRALAGSVDLVAVRCSDRGERDGIEIDNLLIEDVETGRVALLEKGVHTRDILQRRRQEQATLFAQSGVDMVDLSARQDFYASLVLFFKQRMLHARVR